MSATGPKRHDNKVQGIRDRLLKREFRLASELLHQNTNPDTKLKSATGWDQLDQALGGGLCRGALNELCAEGDAIGALETLLPSLLARMESDQPDASTGLWAWVHPERQLHAPALAGAGIPLDRFVAVRPRDLDEQLWALETLLDAGHCDLVVSPLDRVSDTALRRLQLAARRGGSTALLLRPAARAALPSPAPLRMRLRPRPRAALADSFGCSDNFRGLEIEVFKRPGLRTPTTLILEWSPDALDARPLLRLRDRPAHPFSPGAQRPSPGPISHRA